MVRQYWLFWGSCLLVALGPLSPVHAACNMAKLKTACATGLRKYFFSPANQKETEMAFTHVIDTQFNPPTNSSNFIVELTNEVLYCAHPFRRDPVFMSANKAYEAMGDDYFAAFDADAAAFGQVFAPTFQKAVQVAKANAKQPAATVNCLVYQVIKPFFTKANAKKYNAAFKKAVPSNIYTLYFNSLKGVFPWLKM